MARECHAIHILINQVSVQLPNVFSLIAKRTLRYLA